jgi:hypothetical protein
MRALMTEWCVQGQIEMERARGVTVLTADEQTFRLQCADLYAHRHFDLKWAQTRCAQKQGPVSTAGGVFLPISSSSFR